MTALTLDNLITTLAVLAALPVGTELTDNEGGAWEVRAAGMKCVGVRGTFDLDDLGDAAMVMLCAPFRVRTAVAL